MPDVTLGPIQTIALILDMSSKEMTTPKRFPTEAPNILPAAMAPTLACPANSAEGTCLRKTNCSKVYKTVTVSVPPIRETGSAFSGFSNSSVI